MSIVRLLVPKAAAAAGCLAVLLQAAPSASAASAYDGKQVELYVGGSVGGGYDIYARAVGRHIGRHISGATGVVVKNMPGAGSRKLMAWMSNVAAGNAPVLGAVYPGAILDPLIGAKVKYDSLKFNHIGSADSITLVCLARADAGVKTFGDMFRKEIIIGASQSGSPVYDFPAVLANLLGVKMKLVKGYVGLKTMSLALESGEIQGICGYGWSTLTSAEPDWIRKNTVNILLQAAIKPQAELTAMGVPTIWQFIKTPEDKAVMEFFLSQHLFGRPFLMAPGVAADAVAAMRTAFDDTMKDADFVAEAKKLRIAIEPTRGADIQALLETIAKSPKSVLQKAEQVQRPK